MSAFGSISALTPQRVWDGIAGRVVHGEHLTLGVIELDPDVALPEHHHVNEQVGLVISGSLELVVGGEARTLGPGETWTIPPEVPHSGRAGADGAIVVDIFSPPRQDWRALEELPPRPPAWPPTP
jgi:quercetin dioxygenase-like cupin family protein